MLDNFGQMKFKYFIPWLWNGTLDQNKLMAQKDSSILIKKNWKLKVLKFTWAPGTFN